MISSHCPVQGLHQCPPVLPYLPLILSSQTGLPSFNAPSTCLPGAVILPESHCHSLLHAGLWTNTTCRGWCHRTSWNPTCGQHLFPGLLFSIYKHLINFLSISSLSFPTKYINSKRSETFFFFTAQPPILGTCHWSRNMYWINEWRHGMSQCDCE